jgi:hypothetical protein
MILAKEDRTLVPVLKQGHVTLGSAKVGGEYEGPAGRIGVLECDRNVHNS